MSASSDLEQICEHIDIDNPEAATRVANTVYKACEGLIAFPYKGRMSIRMMGWRELVLSPLPYLVIYRVTDQSIEIGRIFHGAQDWR